jgi:hypothetical protein
VLCLAGGILGVLGIAAGVRADQGRTAVLPAGGPPRTAAALDAAIERELARAGSARVIGPLQVRVQLARSAAADPALDAARRGIKAAEDAAIRMKREQAVGAASAARKALRTVRGRFHSPQLVARANGALALALLLKPVDESGAVEAFRRALEADPDYTPDPDRMPPRARELFAQAKEAWRQPRSPEQGAFEQIARDLDAHRVTWVAARSASSERVDVVIAVATERGWIQRRRRLSNLSIEEAAEQVVAASRFTRLSRRAGEPATGSPASKPAAAPSPVPPQPAPPPEPKRWYQRWWVWTAAVVAVGVGATITLSVLLARPSPERSMGLELRF